ncbi:amino acid ABC transporter permease [Sphingobium sp. LMA1-1-1.1]|uniref:amino acid ABC transporter permease n=1 Tax=unclassified Sphingobium TaxID=2611147 RepID=UPI003422BDD5
MNYLQIEPEAVRLAPVRAKGDPWRSMVGSVAHLLTTLVIIVVAMRAIPPLLAWGFTQGIWEGDGEACRNAGACWAFLRVKMPFILFGIYPEAEQWRPMLVVSLFIGLTLWTMPRTHWARGTLLGWAIGLVLALLLMAGGLPGLTPVPTSSWGGLPITLLLTILSLAMGFPLGVALALARRSNMPVFRWAATALIEVARGLPLLTLLFIAAVMTPLLLPAGLALDHLLRALIVFTFSSAAYIAEVVRGGLQGLPHGQAEAAHALGLRRHDILLTVIIPQAVRKALPPLTSTIIVIIKNTSLVMVVGLFDLLSAGRLVLSDPAWPMPYAETYLIIALIYFAICYGFARYALHLERTVGEGKP